MAHFIEEYVGGGKVFKGVKKGVKKGTKGVIKGFKTANDEAGKKEVSRLALYGTLGTGTITIIGSCISISSLLVCLMCVIVMWGVYVIRSKINDSKKKK